MIYSFDLYWCAWEKTIWGQSRIASRFCSV
jgi:hypothetical protein